MAHIIRPRGVNGPGFLSVNGDPARAAFRVEQDVFTSIPTAGTLLMWIRPGSTTVNGTLIGRTVPVSFSGYCALEDNVAAGYAQLYFKRATANWNVRVTTANLRYREVGRPMLLVFRWDTGLAASAQQLWTGDADIEPSEVPAYSIQQLGSGAHDSIVTANPFRIGANLNFAAGYPGDIGPTAMFRDYLNPEEIRSYWAATRLGLVSSHGFGLGGPRRHNMEFEFYPGESNDGVIRDYGGKGYHCTQLARAASGRGLPRWPIRTAPRKSVSASTWHFTNTAAGDGWPILQLEGTAPSDATIGTGWDVTGVATGQYARMAYGVIRDPSTFGGTAQPSGGPDSSLKDAWRTSTAISGTMPAGTATFRLPLVAVSGTGANVRVRFRLWRSANADGSSPTEITGGAAVGATLTVSGTAQVSDVSVALGAVTLTAEYLFAQVALEVT